tara:strand:- start:646 stop:1125 length:480 start_codon:yes stop_codon:yes gene_type:complete
MKKISIFVDVQNIYYTTTQMYGRNFNYNQFWRDVTKNRIVIKAYAYAVCRKDKKQKEFQNILRGIGFEVKLKPFISRSDGSSKGDWDVGITIDVMDLAKKSDIVILASGDGDFEILIKKIRDEFKTECEIYGVPKLTSTSLISAATRFFPISEEHLIIR